MRSAFLIALILFSTICTSAQGRLFDLMTLKKSKSESFDIQKEALKNWGVDTENLYIINPLLIDSMASSIDYNLNTHFLKQNDFSPIHFRIFDKTGKLQTGWEYCFGNINKLRILNCEKFATPSYLPLNKSLTLEKTIKLTQNSSNENNLTIEQLANYDFVIFAFWASYYGSAARKMLTTLSNFQANCSSKILVIKVNYNGYED